MLPIFYAKIFLPLLLLTAAFGMYLNYADPPIIGSGKQCKIDLTQECIVIENEQQVSVRFLQEIEIEEENLLVIKVHKDIRIKQMWVQGINMYMGKNAVIIDSVYVQSTKKVYNSRLLLGSCSEPAMRWQLVIQTTDDSQSEMSWFFNFSTNRNKKS